MNRLARNINARSDGIIEALRTLATAPDRAARDWFAAAVIFVMVAGVTGGLAPLALKAIVDAVSGGARQLDERQGIAFALTYVAALVVQRLCEQLQTYAYGKGEQRVLRRFTSGAFDHLIRLPLAVHLDEKSGAVAQALNEAALGVRLICTHAVITILPLVVQIVVSVIVLSKVFGAGAAAALGLSVVVYTSVFAWGIARLASGMRAISAAQVNAGGATTDALMNVETIKAFTAERRISRLYDRTLEETEAAWGKFLVTRLQNGLMVTMVFSLLIGAAVVGGLTAVRIGGLSLGGFVLVNTYALQLVRPLEMVGFAVRDISQGYAYIGRLLVLLKIPAETGAGLNLKTPEQPSIGPADLAFDHVSFAFGSDRPTLTDVSFKASPGQFIGVVGPSGAGKSSLVRLALRFYDPAIGEVRLDGRPRSAWALEAWRDQIALVSQDTILFNDTIGANIAFAREDASKDAISEAASIAKLDGLLTRLPERLETRVGERGLKLSGGEKQRVSIARAALKRARLVIFDEATAALDPATERAVWQAMRQLVARATTLVVTHRLATVATADQILVLDRGRIVERGRHRELLALKGLYWRLWRSQNIEVNVEHIDRGAAPSLAAG